MPRSLALVFSWAATLFVAISPASGSPIFVGVGDLSGGSFYSDAFAVSADGTVVVGRSRDGVGTQPFRWTLAGGIVGLGHLAGGNGLDVAYAVSANGSAIAGYGGGQAFRWTSSTGMTSISPQGAIAYGISADGSVIAGEQSLGGVFQSFRWSSVDGYSILGSGSGRGISADGTVIVGLYASPGLGQQAYRWTTATAFEFLGAGQANAISSDGNAIVGVTLPAQPEANAFRWTASSGFFELPGGPSYSEAYAVSNGGAVVVGRGAPATLGGGAIDFSRQTAFIYDDLNGYRDLRSVITNEFGLNLTGWTLKEATGISADGRTIVGNGINPDGNTEGWVFTLGDPITPVPEPSSLFLLCCATPVLGVLNWRRHKRRNVSQTNCGESGI